MSRGSAVGPVRLRRGRLLHVASQTDIGQRQDGRRARRTDQERYGSRSPRQERCLQIRYVTSFIHTRMLSPRGQNGLEAIIFGLGLVASGLGLVFGLIVSHPNHVIYVRFFSDRKLLLAL